MSGSASGNKNEMAMAGIIRAMLDAKPAAIIDDELTESDEDTYIYAIEVGLFCEQLDEDKRPNEHVAKTIHNSNNDNSVFNNFIADMDKKSLKKLGKIGALNYKLINVNDKMSAAIADGFKNGHGLISELIAEIEANNKSLAISSKDNEIINELNSVVGVNDNKYYRENINGGNLTAAQFKRNELINKYLTENSYRDEIDNLAEKLVFNHNLKQDLIRIYISFYKGCALALEADEFETKSSIDDLKATMKFLSGRINQKLIDDNISTVMHEIGEILTVKTSSSGNYKIKGDLKECLRSVDRSDTAVSVISNGFEPILFNELKNNNDGSRMIEFIMSDEDVFALNFYHYANYRAESVDYIDKNNAEIFLKIMEEISNKNDNFIKKAAKKLELMAAGNKLGYELNTYNQSGKPWAVFLHMALKSFNGDNFIRGLIKTNPAFLISAVNVDHHEMKRAFRGMSSKEIIDYTISGRMNGWTGCGGYGNDKFSHLAVEFLYLHRKEDQKLLLKMFEKGGDWLNETNEKGEKPYDLIPDGEFKNKVMKEMLKKVVAENNIKPVKVKIKNKII